MITSALRFAINEEEVYFYSLSEFDAEETTGVPEEQLRGAARDLISYFNAGDPTLNLQVDVDGQRQPLFNPREVVHMQDVKDLVRALFFVHEAALAYVMAYVVGVYIWSGDGSLRSLAGQAMAGSLLALGFMAAIGALAASGFSSSWEGFHELFFSNNLWQLDPDRDRLIQMFPEDFWFRAVLFVGGLVVAQALLVAGVAVASSRFARRRARRRRPAIGA